jgi:hypothetical protein
VCTNVACKLRGAEAVYDAARDELGPGCEGVTGVCPALRLKRPTIGISVKQLPVDTRLLDTSGRTGVRPDSVQAPGGKLSKRLPASVIGVALHRFAFPPGTAGEVWLQRGLPSSQ